MDTMVCISYQIPDESKVLPALLNVRVMAYCLLKNANCPNVLTGTVISMFLCKRMDKDGNKLNNNLLNLEWVTLKENIQHAQRMGLRQHYKRGVIKIENGIATHYASVKDAINANGTRPKQMNHWLKGNPTRKGIIYKYENYRKDYGQEIK